jgi:hypothetical protein
MSSRLYWTTGAILAIILAVMSAASCAPGSAQSSSPATHSSASREKGAISQPKVNPASSDAEDFSALLISIDGNGELLLSDSAGRKLGYDAEKQKNFQEIPGGVYDSADDIDDDDSATQAPSANGGNSAQTPASGLKRIEVPEAKAGEYVLKVSSDTAGKYSLNIASLNKQGKQSTVEFKDLPVQKGAAQFYRVAISNDSRQPLQVTRIEGKNKEKQ